ncbi:MULTISPECIES: NirD/YgiW/YdeI family stress tolerance protein [Cupriavidus]|uniref:NirD/YgiW/YdeI family stress tolerance protein n=1 Tax=Cupriavidus pauculus TaxID=82633 RepID=A0A3G8GX60_9BURK|nr:MULTISPECIES: NirD/YgiW/YdeI family stress tolerance protein [Cupriavidus]AZG12694.1 NirD/YgiW/YdeI family stress tolerance protein [Cupriavidus pauculus]MDT6962380.1 NirD/YgiW/YdeI family stress tolerance protein [Cupriavidus sp. SZY C1]
MPRFSRWILVAGAVLASAAAQAQYAGPGAVSTTTTVKDLLAQGRDDQQVLLQGRIVRHLGGEDYEFADATGKMRVEIDHQLLSGHHPAIDDKREVRLTGEFERKVIGQPHVEVDRLEVVR